MNTTRHSVGSDMDTLAAEAETVADMSTRLRLDGRRYVVLGGGRGMGRHTSHSLSQLGADVVVVDSDQDRADAVAREIGAKDPGRVVDATDSVQMQAVADEVGDIDGVVDVIGIARYKPLIELSDDEWLGEHDIVLGHAWLTVRHFGPKLRERGSGSLTFVASVSGMTSAPSHGAYGVFKAGLVSLVRTAAVELGPHHVRVNAVAPGFVLTPRMSQALSPEQFRLSTSASPLPYVIMPGDIADGLTFLVSDMASAITGQTLVIDGGATVTYPYQMREFGPSGTEATA